MNEGLVLLAAWAQWLAFVVALVVLIARRVADAHEGSGTLYERRDGDDRRPPPHQSG